MQSSTCICAMPDTCSCHKTGYHKANIYMCQTSRPTQYTSNCVNYPCRQGPSMPKNVSFVFDPNTIDSMLNVSYMQFYLSHANTVINIIYNEDPFLYLFQLDLLPGDQCFWLLDSRMAFLHFDVLYMLYTLFVPVFEVHVSPI